MTYRELKEHHQNEINNFPLMFAFNKRQFAEGCKKLGINPDNAQDELYSLGAGSFVRKTDRERFNSLFDRFDNDIQEALKDYTFAVDAFRYELENHEYCITGDPTAALNTLRLTKEAVNASAVLSEALTTAIKIVSNYATA